MSPIRIPNKELPYNWLELIENFDIDNSDLSQSLKPLSRKIKQNVLDEEDNSVISYFNKPFILHVCLNEPWRLDKYDSIPYTLMNEAIGELGTERRNSL